MECSDKLIAMETKVRDLELLNEQAMRTIDRLQQESVEKSKKILKLELNQGKASVAVQSDKPRLELRSLVRPNKQKVRTNTRYNDTRYNDGLAITMIFRVTVPIVITSIRLCFENAMFWCKK